MRVVVQAAARRNSRRVKQASSQRTGREGRGDVAAAFPHILGIRNIRNVLHTVQAVKSARVGRGLPAALETDDVMGTATDSGCRTAPLACLGRAPHLGFAVDSMEQVPAVFRSAALQVPAELV